MSTAWGDGERVVELIKGGEFSMSTGFCEKTTPEALSGPKRDREEIRVRYLVMVFSLEYFPLVPSMVTSPTNRYSPGSLGEYEHSPSRSVPEISVHGLVELSLRCHFEVWVV